MTSKKIIAFMLTVCMLLSCMPAFAAKIYLEEDTVFTDAGFDVVLSGGNRHFTEGTDNHFTLVIDGKYNGYFPQRAETDHYKGVTASFSATQKNPPEGSVAEFTVDDAEVFATRAAGTGELCLSIKHEEIIASSPELSALKAAGKTDEEVLDFEIQSFPWSTIGTVTVKQGTWEAEHVDAGVFPEDTVFLRYQEFLKYPSEFHIESNYSFTDLIFENSRGTSGPYQFFVPETTGEYNVYVQLVSNNGDLDNRAVKLSIDGKELNFKPGDYEAALLPTSMKPLWCYETTGKTVTLMKDEIVAVQLNGKAYGRPTAIAFVPANENADVLTAIKAAPQTLQITLTDIEKIANPYHPAFAEGELSVTVNGESVTASAGVAAKKSSTSYVRSDGKTAYGLPVRVLPETNTFPTYPTVLDAIAKYMLAKGSETPVQATAIHDGKIDDFAVFVNDKLVTDIDWVEIKDGDTVELKAKNTSATFDPVPIKGFSYIETNNLGLIEAVGTPDDKGNTYPDGQLKFCLNKANAVAAIGDYASSTDNQIGLKDCYIVGYMNMRSIKTSYTYNGATIALDADSKLFFENIPIIGYNVDENGILKQDSVRVDLITGGKVGYNGQDPRCKVKDAEGNTVTFVNADGEFVLKPYEYYADQYLYLAPNLYIVNKSTDVSLKAMKGKNKYTLTTGGMHVVDVVIATYAEDGVTITGTQVLKEQIVMFNDPLDIPVAANQKAFVWGTKIYEGTTMMPVMKPLLGSNFAN